MLRVVVGERLSLLTSDVGRTEIERFLDRQSVPPRERSTRRVVANLYISRIRPGSAGSRMARALGGIRRLSFHELGLVVSALLGRGFGRGVRRIRATPPAPAADKWAVLDKFKRSIELDRALALERSVGQGSGAPLPALEGRS